MPPLDPRAASESLALDVTQPPPASPATVVDVAARGGAATHVDSGSSEGDLANPDGSRWDALDGGAGSGGDEGFARRYEVRRLIGEGGMGEVRLCRDGRIGREVALKVVRKSDSPSQADQLDRFLREARVQGQLEHPAIVPVYDLGRDPAGAPYFTMKRVRGLTLADIVDKLVAAGKTGDLAAVQHYSRRKLLGAFSSVCMAIDYAHSRGVLHRDLKPSNIMLGDFGEVYVLDWGLAKVKGDDSDGKRAAIEVAPARAEGQHAAEPVSDSTPGRTEHGAIMGTPGYMPPEQLRGEIDKLDARSDVYSLGAILFELLALRPLHARSTAADLIASSLTGTDARPSCAQPDVPPELDALCVRATALVREDRFPSARELHDALERYLDGDRDLERRRELAASHAADAEACVPRALAGDTDARTSAMRAVGRALALDPANAVATRTMVRLLTEPPTVLPDAARAEVNLQARQSQRSGARLSALTYLSWFLYMPFTLFMGVRSWPYALITSSAWLLAAVLSWWVWRNPRPRGEGWLPAVVVSSVAMGCTALIVGPLLLTPAVAAINALAFMLSPSRRHRLTVVVLGCLAVAVPYALEVIGWLPPSYRFTSEGLVILPRMLNLPSFATTLFLCATSIGMVLTAALEIAKFRDTLTRAEERLHMTTWQLKQIVPEEASAATGGPLVDDDSVASLCVVERTLR